MLKLFPYLLAYFVLLISPHIFATDLPPVVLPEDEGTHNYDLEWWYYTGHLESLENGAPRKFAFEMTVFRGEPLETMSGYVAHFALIDLDEKTHNPFQRINPFAARRPPAPSEQGFKFVFDGGQWLVTGKDGHDRLKAKTSKYAIDLDLTSIKAPALFGDQGIVDYGSAGQMAYYSRTRMNTLGWVTAPGKDGRPQNYRVTGMSWMDHQWGDSGNPGQMGWDWFSIQLQNESDLMFFRVRNRESNEILKTSGFIVSASGEVSSIPGALIDIQAISTTTLTKALYPSEWTIKVPAPYGIDFKTKARFPDQRFKAPVPITPIYWEGSCTTEGYFQGNPIQGQGFTEMAGYE